MASSQEAIDPGGKEVLARIASAAAKLERLSEPGPDLLALYTAVEALARGGLELAKGLTETSERSIGVSVHPLWSIVKGRSAALPFFLGMTATILTMPIVWLYMQWLLMLLWSRSPNHTVLDIDSGLLLFVAWGGGLGAEVSMMLRLPAYASKARLSGPMSERQTLFLAGFFRPWIGVGFAIFVYMLLRSGLIKIGGGELNPLVYLSLAFVTGFSERLGADLASRAEGTLEGRKVPGADTKE